MKDPHLEWFVAPKPKKNRFCVFTRERLCSALWSVWQNKNDIYAATAPTGGVLKLSLHGSLVCQFAMTQQFYEGNPNFAGEPRPTLHRWKRLPTPNDGFHHVVTIMVPVNYIAGEKKEATAARPITYIVGVANETASIGFMYSRLDPEVAFAELRKSSLPIWWFQLDNGDFVYLAFRTTPDEPIMLANGRPLGPPRNLNLEGMPRHLVIEDREVRAGQPPGRNVVILLATKPNDGSALFITEIGENRT